MKLKNTLALLTSLFIVSCSSNTYEIINAEYNYTSSQDAETSYKTSTAILLNKETGETWEIYPTEEGENAQYEWIKQNKESIEK